MDNNEGKNMESTDRLADLDLDDKSEDEIEVDDLRGPRPGLREACRNKCFDCCGDMIDGRQDCQIVSCALYYWQPYRKLKPDLSWRTEGMHLSKNRAALRERIKATRSDGQDVSEVSDEEDHDV